MSDKFYRLLAMLLALVAMPLGASAIVFSFNDSNINFVDGVLDQSFDIDPNNDGDGAGNDIRISFTRDTEYFQNYAGQDSPFISNLFGNGSTPDADTLALIVDFAEDVNRIRVRIDFLYANGVSGVTIPTYDVDRGSEVDGQYTFTDEVDRIRSRFDGVWTDLDASTVTLDPLTNAYSADRNSIYGIELTDNNADGGNFVLDFEETIMTRLTFDYRNFVATTQNNPALQGIGLGDINFTAVPEPSQYALILGLGAVFCVMNRRQSRC